LLARSTGPITNLLSGGWVSIGKFGGDGLTRSKMVVAVAELGERGVVVGVAVVFCMVAVASWDILVGGVVWAVVNVAEVGMDTGVAFFVGVDIFIGGVVEADSFSFDDLGIGDGAFEGAVGVFVE
jgi:hypothetical protein